MGGPDMGGLILYGACNGGPGIVRNVPNPDARLFPQVFHGGRMKGQDVMTSNVACHAMLWIEKSNEHPKTRDQQKHNIEISQNRLV